MSGENSFFTSSSASTGKASEYRDGDDENVCIFCGWMVEGSLESHEPHCSFIHNKTIGSQSMCFSPDSTTQNPVAPLRVSSSDNQDVQGLNRMLFSSEALDDFFYVSESQKGVCKPTLGPLDISVSSDVETPSEKRTSRRSERRRSMDLCDKCGLLYVETPDTHKQFCNPSSSEVSLNPTSVVPPPLVCSAGADQGGSDIRVVTYKTPGKPEMDFCIECGLLYTGSQDSHNKVCKRPSVDLSINNMPGHSDKSKPSSEVTDFRIVIEDNICLPVKNQYGQIVQGSQCDSCKKIYTSKRNLDIHLRENPECSGYTHECSGCGGRFRTSTGLSQHRTRSQCGNANLEICLPVKNKYGKTVQGLQCDACKMIFNSKRYLNVHLRENPDCSGYVHECSGCGGRFGTNAGLKQHRTRSECGNVNLNIEPNLEIETGEVGIALQPESTDVPLTGVESNHVPCTLPMSQSTVDSERQILASLPSRNKIKWPPMKDNAQWDKLDERIIKQIPKSDPPLSQLKILQEVVYSEASELFGCVVSNQRYRNRRECKSASVKKQIDNLTNLACNAESDHERGAILLVKTELLEKLRKMRRAENTRKARWRRKRARKNFYNNPFKASKDILSGEQKTRLKVSKETMDRFVQEVASDPQREADLPPLPGLPEVPDPQVPFNEKPFSFSVYKKFLKKTRNASSPGPNGTPYKVYKKCKKTASLLFSIINAVRKSGKIPLCWRISDGPFIPKVDNPKEDNISDFRQIALMNVEGKIFWALVQDRLYNYLVEDNKFIKTSAQKGSIRRVPGCWEHTSMVWNLLRDAKTNKKPLVLLWLDLANAYGSVPHKLIELGLRRYKVPEPWIKLVLDYYDGLWGRSSGDSVKSEWVKYEKGIFAGCTVSVILFLLAFNLIIEYIQAGKPKEYVLNGKPVEVVRGFMDDISLAVPSIPIARFTLRRTIEVLAWARMALKPSKSRSAVLARGKLKPVEPFSVNGTIIPGLQNKPLRTLGRNYDKAINDQNAKVVVMDKFMTDLKKLDKSYFTGFMKSWAAQNVLLKQIEWDFLIYELPIRLIEEMERKQSVFLRKWLGVARCLTDVALYSNQVPCPLPFNSLLSVFKKSKVRSYLQLKYSQDQQVSTSARQHNTGTKWKTVDAIEDAESRQRFKKVVGNVRGVKANAKNVSARAGLGFGQRQEDQSPAEGSREHRKQIANLVDQDQEEEYTAKAVGQYVQGVWVNWKDYINRDISWKTILSTKPELFRFCVGATYDTLATPKNTARWGMTDDAKCALCSHPSCTIRHILSACPVSLVQGRYEYRHNQVLRCIAHGIQSFLNTNKVVSKKGIRQIHFVKETGSAFEKRSRKPELGILHKASDFVMSVDLERRLKYPEHIAEVGQRPDIVIYSNSLRLVIHFELTCPCEENFELRHKEKGDRYGVGSKIEAECTANGWTVVCLPVEVGARGYAAVSLRSSLRRLGLGKMRTKTVIKNASDAALRASFWMWLLRNRLEWKLSTSFKSVSSDNLDRNTERVCK